MRTVRRKWLGRRVQLTPDLGGRDASLLPVLLLAGTSSCQRVLALPTLVQPSDVRKTPLNPERSTVNYRQLKQAACE